MTLLNCSKDFRPTLKSIHSTFLLILLFCLSNSSFAQTKAFPEAEGFGKYASGGRGGTVIKVTNLNDSGPGSLRQALMYTSGARTIEFEVGGTITLNTALSVYNGNVTIAGQTAPGDGILIKGSMVMIETSNVIMRYIRFRPGNSQPNTPDGLSITSWGNTTVENIIIDHCSMSWADDENFDIRVSNSGTIRNITIQHSIISECTYGALASNDTYNITYYKNMFAHNQERNVANNFPVNNELDFEMINNLIYGCANGTQMALGASFTIINNHFKESSQQSINPNIIDGTTAGQGTPSNTYAYVSGNLIPNGKNEYSNNLIQYLRTTPFASSGVVAIPANQVANDIISHVGASLPNRDAVDVRLISQYNNNTGTVERSGTYPVLQNGTPLLDSDNDGMPNVWETQNGLNINNPSDRNVVRPDGYTNLEYYLNGMTIAVNSVPICSNEITSFPYNEGFENTLGAWTQSSADEIDWTINANGTPSSGTGPSSASQDTYYTFVEASGNPTKQAVLNSPCFNLTNLSNANFSFKYHQYGSNDEGTIDVEASDDNGVSWTSLWNSSGNLGDSWQTATIDLDTYVGGNVQLRFNRVIGNSYQADIAIDDVSLVATSTINNGNTGCSGDVNSFPYSEGFENTLGAWTQSSNNDMDWTVNSNGTPSNGTGPSNASQGTYYAYVEVSGNLNKQAILNSPCFDLSSLSNANFSFKYHQYGSSDMGNFDLEASDDNGASWTSIWNSSGDLGDAWLTANIDISTYVGGIVQFRFNRVTSNNWKADIAIDNVNLTESVSTGTTSCSEGINSFPYTEGFENTLGAWTQSTADDMDWTINANVTPSKETGPSNALQGTYYAFVEASGNPAQQAVLNSPCFDLSSLSNANFSFKYHQYGSSDMGTIDLEASDDNGANWTSIWNSSGDLGNVWLTANIDLNAYVGGNVQLRFNRVIGNSYQADIAIDNVNLSESANTGTTGCSGGITSFPYSEGFENTLGAWTQSSADEVDWIINANKTPSKETGPSSASQGTYYAFVEASGNPAQQAVLNSPCFNLTNLSNANFSFKYHQYGSSDIGTMDLEASDDNGASWTSIWNSSGDLGDSWLTANIDLSAYVGGNVQLRFNRVIGNSYRADIAIDDVTLSESVTTGTTGCSGGINSFPYTEGFENTLGAWTQSSGDDMDWVVNANGTPSNGTGPSNASQGTYYAFVEASSNLTKQAVLNSPCFDLSGQSSAQFSFNYHQFGSSNMGTIDLEASNDDGVSWTSIWNSSGNSGNSWLTADVDLGAYAGGNVQLRFNRITGNTWQADIALDNINLSVGLTSKETTTETKEITTETAKSTAIVLEDIKDIILYPNPVKGNLLNIKSTYTDISFEIYNMVGQVVSKGNVKHMAIDVSNLNGAMYQIRFSSEGETITKRFIKQ